MVPAEKQIRLPERFLIRRFQDPFLLQFLALNPSDILLDAGCGEGQFAFRTCRKVKAVFGVDVAVPRPAHLFMMRSTGNLHFVRGDLQNLPFRPGFFDKISLSSVLQMVPDDVAALSECCRVLKQTGTIALSVPYQFMFLKKAYLHTILRVSLISFLNSSFDFPSSYDQLLAALFRRLGAFRRGSYTVSDLEALAQNSGLRIERVVFTPKCIGSLWFETWVIAFLTLGFKWSNRLIMNPRFRAMASLCARIEQSLPGKWPGDEVLASLRKVH
jgi:ubiquinone/menaquinone biosynthesis C-methylase UbiE